MLGNVAKIPWPLHPASWKAAGQGHGGDLVTRNSLVKEEVCYFVLGSSRSDG